MPKLYAVHIPEYTVEAEPDFAAIGAQLDGMIIKLFEGQNIAIRAIGSQDHPGKSVPELVKIILETGTDRYDPDRAGDRYENVEGKHIDLFALPVPEVAPDSEMLGHMLRSFYEYPQKTGKPPVQVDIITIYDMDQLTAVAHRYKGRPELKNDGFVFKDQSRKPEAIRAIIVVG